MYLILACAVVVHFEITDFLKLINDAIREAANERTNEDVEAGPENDPEGSSAR